MQLRIHGVFTAVSEICAVLELCENARIGSPALPTLALLTRPDALNADNADVVGVQNVHID